MKHSALASLKLSLFLGICLLSGCGGDEGDKDEGNIPDKFSGDVSAGARENLLTGLPGEVHRSQKDSRINWQPWEKESFTLARDSNRLILAVIALPQQPSFHGIFRALDQDDGVVDEINNNYIPVLVDGDSVREIGLLTAVFCAEIGSSLQLPLMVWMTPDANPVAWIPLPSTGEGSVPELFNQSHIMVGRMWTDDPSYVFENSAMDQQNRHARMLEHIENRKTSVDVRNDAITALRQLTSLYDSVSRTFDETGSLFPSGALDLLVLGARMEGIPADLRNRCRMVAGYLLDDVLTSPMFDPLDGGVFSSRHGSSWDFPRFHRDSATQARIASSLLGCFEVTGDKRALYRAMGVMDFIERKNSDGNGLFTLSSEVADDTKHWLWREEEVKAILNAEEMELWAEAAGMESMGNLPSESDPLRAHFRANTFAYVKSPEEIAVAKGTDPVKAREIYESARRKLLKVRDERLENGKAGAEANATATFRMASLYASAYRITGDEDFREKAVSTLAVGREHFSNGPRLRLYAGGSPDSITAGRAFLYGLALQSALDVAAITLDENWLNWADDLATTAAELFGTETHVMESPPGAGLVDLPVSDLSMLFDESTAGLLAMAGARLAALGRPLLGVLDTQVVKLPVAAIHTPVLHTDVLQGALMREFGMTYVYGPEISAESRAALSRLPLKAVNRGPEGRNHSPAISVRPTEILRIIPGNEPVSIKELN